MRCKHCNSRLAIHDLWCSNCGHQTQIVRKDLSAWQSIKSSWQTFKPQKSASAPAAAFVILVGVIPIMIFMIILNMFGYLDLLTNPSTSSLLINLLILAGGVAALLPILFVPFDAVSSKKEYYISLKDLLSSLKRYPKYLILSLFVTFYFVLIFVICFGLPDFGSDPILRLVWLVLVNYFLAIMLPVPILMHRNDVNAWKALKISYKNFHVVRWQKYLIVLILAAVNLLAALLFVVPLLITVPFTWFAIRDYTDLLLSYEIVRGDSQGVD